MISDQLLSARMVIANGSIATVSQDENPDLFWAVRGAGGNFGIVVEATYQLTNLTSKYVINMDYAFRSNASAAIVDYLSSFGETPPAKLSFMIAGLYDEDQFGGVQYFQDSSLPMACSLYDTNTVVNTSSASLSMPSTTAPWTKQSHT